MYSSRLVFLIVFFFCSVHTYRSENERSAPAYESAEEEFSEELHHKDVRSGPVAEEEETLVEEEAYEPKPNKKSKKHEKYAEVVPESGHRQEGKQKKAKKVEESVPEAGEENAEDSIYNKEMKNVSNKKPKKYNKKYESGKRHDIGGKGQPTYEELNPETNEKAKTSKKESKRVRRSDNKREQMSDSAPQEKAGKYGKRSESDPSAEVSQESKPVKQNQKTENNRKSKSGKNGKQSKKKNGSHKKDKRSFAYFGLWA